MKKVLVVVAAGALLLTSLVLLCACASDIQAEAVSTRSSTDTLEEVVEADAERPSSDSEGAPVSSENTAAETQVEDKNAPPQASGSQEQSEQVAPEAEEPEAPAESGSDEGESIAGLIGWWKSDFSMYMIWRFEPNGTFLMKNLNPRFGRQGMPMLNSGHVSMGDGALMISESSEGLPPNIAGWTCSVSQVGMYDLEVPSPGLFDLTVVKDPCAGRESWYDTGMFRAVDDLEDLLGTWRSDADQARKLQFREDLTYGREEGAGENADMVGAINIEEGLLKVHDVSPPCSITDVGLYRIAFGDDGVLSLEAVQEDCEERRLALAGWGPFRREETRNELMGWWSSDGEAYQLQINPGGTYAVYDVGNLAAGPLDWGALYLDEGQMHVVGQLGVADCAGRKGTYDYRLEKDTLELELAADPCTVRAGLLSAHTRWTRAAPLASE